MSFGLPLRRIADLGSRTWSTAFAKSSRPSDSPRAPANVIADATESSTNLLCSVLSETGESSDSSRLLVDRPLPGSLLPRVKLLLVLDQIGREVRTGAPRALGRTTTQA
jgi:hypothetical protein